MSPAIARTAGLIVAGSLAVCSEASTSASPSQRSTASAALKIVVVAGEDAVNIVQQKTAVAPIIEVRDRNDQPVAGAVVTFAIRGGRASFGGARTLAVTTDAAGRAVAGGVTPTASGAVQISATVEFQGQTTAVTITQTNVLTAAQAAAVSTVRRRSWQQWRTLRHDNRNHRRSCGWRRRRRHTSRQRHVGRTKLRRVFCDGLGGRMPRRAHERDDYRRLCRNV